jgi:hypothetical protein
MKSSEECRARATESERMAAETRDSRAREMLLSVAAQWRSLAEMADPESKHA